MATVHVGPGQAYARISDGAVAAGNGGTVIVHQADYFEQVVIRTPNVTIIANSGDTPVVTGRLPFSRRDNPTSGVLPGGEWRPWVSIGNNGGASFKWTALVLLAADGITWDGINSSESTGRGIQLGDGRKDGNGNYYRYPGIEIKNTEIAYHRGSGFVFYHTDDVKLTNCTLHHCVNFYLGDETSHGTNHPGCINFVGVKDPIITDCTFYYNGGESFCFDSNNHASTGLIVRGTTLSDGKEVITYLHASEDIFYENCVFYGSVDRDAWGGAEQKGFRGFKGVPIELESYNRANQNPTFCGVQNVEIRNSLFVDMGSNMKFGSAANIPCTTYYRNWLITGCTFVQTQSKAQLAIESSAIDEASNIVFEGNLFYVTDPSYGNIGIWPSGFTFKNNIWNYNPGNRFLQGSNDIYNADVKMNNPTAVIHRNGINVNNYKVLSGSAAINEWASPISNDYFGNLRTIPSDYGFHDLEATGDDGGDNVPYASFTLSENNVELGTEVTAIDTSIPSSGATIVETAWLLTLPGTDIQLISLSPSFVFGLNIVGNYTLQLTVVQDNDGESTISKGITVYEEDGEDPPPPPPDPPPCNLGTWQQAVNNGSPKFSVVDNVYSIENDPGDQGMFLSWWNTVVTAAEEFTLSAEFFVEMEAGNYATMFALFYDSGNSLLGNVASVSIQPNSDFTLVELAAIAPTNAVKLRMDIRAWNGAGKLSFKEPCVVEDTTLPDDPPQAVIEATSGGQPLLADGVVPLNETIYFEGVNSIDAVEYKWQLYKQIGRKYELWRDPVYLSAIAHNMDDAGAFVMRLTVTSAEGLTNYENLFFKILDPIDALEVWFTVNQVLTSGIPADDTVTGNSPLTVQFEAYYESDGLALIGHVWELLDDQRETIDTIASKEDPIIITFPYVNLGWTEEITIDYGMRLTSTFEGYLSKSHVQYLVVSVTVTPINQIGPAIPATISPITGNRIKSDGSHEHELAATITGEINKVPVSDPYGVLFAHFLAAGYQDPILSSWHNNYSISAEKGIKFNLSAWLTAPEIVLDSISIIVPLLPTADPNTRGALWIDSNDKLSVSPGIESTPPISGGTFVGQIGSSYADAQEASNGVMTMDNGTVRIQVGYDFLGLHFPNVTIPNSATIISASIEVTLGTTRIADMDISLDDSDDAAAFTATAYDISNRTLTTQVLQLREGSVPDGQYVFNVPISAIQAVVDRGGWASGNALAVMLGYVATSNFSFQAYDYAPLNAAEITIEYA